MNEFTISRYAIDRVCRRLAIVGVLLVLGLTETGCSTLDFGIHAQTGSPPSPGPVIHDGEPRYGNLGIPPGHLPPPGECRVWFPGRPPGQQPPPQKCGSIGRVPLGAWLIEHPTHDRDHVHVNVYDQARPGRTIEVRVYNANTGGFVRVNLP